MSKYSVKKPFTVLGCSCYAACTRYRQLYQDDDGSVAEYFPPVHTCDHNLSRAHHPKKWKMM